uniref:NADH-ubiquinone oxidoreductase chain 4 n=1 Tax=Cherax destructor TaxID=6723 RepID=W6MY96_CHEDE|nr:NADH dehydrogenase subunit 4 [Cherax destructor]AIA61533.1 NADH dehydrogenase subunit 4 [Cherax destructor]UNJ13900.1 NADH dehydrogenase subunit 4 [Cherax destructor]WRV01070.1 NADH dehydrogenase subunit 4 [Cherax destructor albidus]CDL72706.1 NADH dehydrogenase subunit 4 [Cherax destructor]
MLKFLVLNMVLMSFVMNWNLIQMGLLVMCFITLLMVSHDFYFFCLGYMMGVDYLSYVLIVLSVWIVMLMVYSSSGVKKTSNFSSGFLLVNLGLLVVLVLTFSSVNYLMFYISFESSLIPMLVLILGWGYQPERIQAGVYMLFYTLFASLPLLVSLLSLYSLSGSLNMGLLAGLMSGPSVNILWYFCTVFAFMVKLPLFLFHLWLPKAHVEAPVSGSMILAGVLLKLGGYGLIRVLSMFSEVNKMFSWVWMSLGILGGMVISLMCLRQVDMKSLIAYSSVAHMGLVLGGLVSMSSWGLNGALVVMVGHGLCSSGLFCLANMVYERLGSRSLMISKGLLSFMPSMGFWWFLLVVGNMAAPPTLNLMGEISLIISVVSWSKLVMLGVGALSFFSAAYTLYMYSLSQHGLFASSFYSCCSGKVGEYFVLMLHGIPLNVVFMKGVLVLSNL